MEDQKVIRTFVAVLLDEELRSRISDVQERVRNLVTNVRWVAPENFHVTLKFLGNVSQNRVSRVQAALDEVTRGIEAFDLSISGMGVFPNLRRPRVVWVGAEEGREQLVALAKAVEHALVRLGFEKEDKPFKSHITIGRVREGKPTEGLAELESIDAADLGAQRIAGICLMESVIKPGGPEYTPLSVHKLVEV